MPTITVDGKPIEVRRLPIGRVSRLLRDGWVEKFRGLGNGVATDAQQADVLDAVAVLTEAAARDGQVTAAWVGENMLPEEVQPALGVLLPLIGPQPKEGDGKNAVSP